MGGGTPFLPPVTKDLALELLEAKTFGSRPRCRGLTPDGISLEPPVDIVRTAAAKIDKQQRRRRD